jgi:MFS family permease
VSELSAPPSPGRLARALERAPSLLRENRDFRRFWTGQAVSLFGDQITQLAVPLVAVLVLDAGPAQMGYLTAANLVPYLLFPLHAGAWVDRRARRRQVMIAADLGRGLLVATVPIAYALGQLTIAQLYAVAFLTGTLSVLFFVSQSTLVVSLVSRGDYIEANSLLHGSRTWAARPSPGCSSSSFPRLTLSSRTRFPF